MEIICSIVSQGNLQEKDIVKDDGRQNLSHRGRAEAFDGGPHRDSRKRNRCACVPARGCDETDGRHAEQVEGKDTCQ